MIMYLTNYHNLYQINANIMNNIMDMSTKNKQLCIHFNESKVLKFKKKHESSNFTLKS